MQAPEDGMQVSGDGMVACNDRGYDKNKIKLKQYILWYYGIDNDNSNTKKLKYQINKSNVINHS